MATNQHIIKNLKKNDISTLLDDTQVFLETSASCSDVCVILKALHQDLSSKFSKGCDEHKTSIFALIPVVNLCVDYVQSNFSCAELEEHQFPPLLYHIIRIFLKSELFGPAVLCAESLRNFLSQEENKFAEKLVYAKNIGVLLWNEAYEIEKSRKFKYHDLSFKLRSKAIDFLFLEEINSKIVDKVTLTIMQFCKNNEQLDLTSVRSFLENLWQKLRHIDLTYSHSVCLFKNIYSWLVVLLKYTRDLTIIKCILPWFDYISNCNSKHQELEQNILNFCVEISKICVQLFTFKESLVISKENLLKYQNNFRLFEKCKAVCANVFAVACSFIYLNFIQNSQYLRTDEKFLMLLDSNMEFCILLIQHYLIISSEEDMKKHFSFSLSLDITISHALVNLFNFLLIRKEETPKKEVFLKSIQNFIEFSACQLKAVDEVKVIQKQFLGYITCIESLGFGAYSSGLYSKSCHFLEISCSLLSKCDYSTEKTKNNLWKMQEILAHSYFLSGSHEKALQVVVQSLLIHDDKLKECLELWQKVKKNAVRCEKATLLPIIISDVLLQLELTINVDKEIDFLMEELKACRAGSCKFNEEITAVVCKLLTLPCQDIIRAHLFLEIINMPALIICKISSALKKSELEMCLESIKLYKKHLDGNPTNNEVKLKLSVVYFWLYQFKQKALHEVAHKEVQTTMKSRLVESTDKNLNDDDDENDACDIKPTLPLVTLLVEVESIKNLDYSVHLWEEVFNTVDGWSGLGDIIKDLNLLDIIQATAEIFSTAVHDLKELKLWILLHKVSSAIGNKASELSATISIINNLVKLGYLKMVSHLIDHTEKDILPIDACSNDFEILKLKFQLSKSSFCFHAGKFDEGLTILQDSMNSPKLEKSYKSVKMLQAELLLLYSHYQLTPPLAFTNSENKEYLLSSTAIASAMESISLSKGLLKYIAEREHSSSLHNDWIYFKPMLIKIILKAHLHLGELFFQAGDPRFARCYLQEGLKMAESHVLTFWSSKFLIILGHIDLLCDNADDCLVKINGLKYIINKDDNSDILSLLSQMSIEEETSHSPLSPDDLIIHSNLELTLQRYIKQKFIKNDDVNSSPVPRVAATSSRFVKIMDCESSHVLRDLLSYQILELEICALSCFHLIAQGLIEQAEAELKSILVNYDKLKHFDKFYNILLSIKPDVFPSEEFLRYPSKCEIMLLVFVSLKLSIILLAKGNTCGAESYISSAMKFLMHSSAEAKYLYPNIYAVIKYHEIEKSLNKFLNISHSFSAEYHICPSVKGSSNLVKDAKVKSVSLTSVLTPKSNVLLKMNSTDNLDSITKCKAPLKRNVLPSHVKKDIAKLNSSVEVSSLTTMTPLIFSSSDDETGFENPKYVSDKKTTPKLKGKQKKSSTKVRDTEKNSHKFFKSKHDNLNVVTSGDIWTLTLLSTPKGEKNIRPRSLRTRPKNLEVKGKKTGGSKSESICSQNLSKSKFRLKKNTNDFMAVHKGKQNISNENNSQSLFYQHTERPLPIECSRSSPRNRISSNQNEQLCESKNYRCFDEYLCTGDVFLSPDKGNSDVTKLSFILDDVCKNFSGITLTKSKNSSIRLPGIKEYLRDLSEIRELVQRNFPYPLYANICRLMALLTILQNDDDKEYEAMLKSGFLLSETFSITLQHLYVTNLIYLKNPGKIIERNSVMKLLKMKNSPIHLQMENILKAIPETWTIIQISALSEKECLSNQKPLLSKLIICQYKQSMAPIVICSESLSEGEFNSSLLMEFENILVESTLTMKSKDSKKWWKTRSTLDMRLKSLAQSMETVLLGCWKSLFLGIPTNEQRIVELSEAANAISQIAVPVCRKLLQVLLDSALYLTREQLSAFICYLWNCSPLDEVYSKIYGSIRNVSFSLPATERNPVILILDKTVQALPWECIPILQDAQVSRMPSLSILYCKIMANKADSCFNKGLDCSNAFYVLNPSGDLVQSQEYFQPQFEKQTKWKGVIGRAPTSSESVSAFQDYDLFIYCGHGSGKHYLEGSSFEKLRFKASTILMGCSSGRLKQLGRQLEANGIALRYLLNGCPCIVANLWDVTDKDIDRFTEKLLEILVPNYNEKQNNSQNIAIAASKARNACKMRYLVGAAPVIYGFPVFASS